MTEISYLDFVQAVQDYYGYGSDQWLEIATYGRTSEHFVEIASQLPGYKVTYSNSGAVIKYEQLFDSVSSGDASIINSNAPSTVVQNSYPATVDVVEGEVVAEKGIASVGAKQFLFKEVVPAIAAASVGLRLGKTIDKLAYESGFNWLSWAGVELESLNPETWNSITTNDTLIGTAFNLLYGLDPNDNSTTAYLDENALAYLALYMQKTGMLENVQGEEWDGRKPQSFDVVEPVNTSTQTFTAKLRDYLPEKEYYEYGRRLRGSEVEHLGFEMPIESNNYKVTSAVVDNAVTGIITGTSNFGTTAYGFTWDTDAQKYIHTATITTPTQSYTFDNKTVYYAVASPAGPAGGALNTNPANFTPSVIPQLAWVTQYGTFTPKGIPGIGNQTGAVIPSLNNNMSVQDVLNALKNQYPDWWDDALDYPVMQPDGTVTHTTYVPVSIPSAVSNTDTKPTGDGSTSSQTKPKYNPSTDPKSGGDDIVKTIQPPGSKTPPNDGGSGDTPVVIVPTGSANALYSIYNPTQSELNSFGAWLWSSDFVDQLLKLFNDPMQAIIGLHKVFATPSTSGTGPIKVGYLSSGVSAKLVNNQYVTIDCGTISLKEKFGNVFDYDPYTQVYIYLPFIGIQKLDTGDVMRGNIKVVYHVDVLTGACLAEINVNRDMAGGIIYTFSGNCAVQYPISSGSYMGIVTSIASIAGSVVGTVASGGALAPLAMGAVSGVLNAHTRVSHSGAFSGAPGAMGVKKPYLIITRAQTFVASTFPHFDGYPTNVPVLLSSCSGYVRCEGVHLENVPATEPELAQIEDMLKSGVLI